MRRRILSAQLKHLQQGLVGLRRNHTQRAEAHGLGRSCIRPGVCGVPHLHQPPCDHFEVLRYDLKKRSDASVQPSLLQPWHDPTKQWHPKVSTVGLVGGAIHVMFKPNGIGGKGPYVDPVTVSVTRLLHELAYEADLPDFEIRINGADAARGSGSGSGCDGHFFTASMATDPAMCDIGLPTGLRVEYTPWAKATDGSLHYDPQDAVLAATGVERATPSASKPYTKVSYSGSLWPAVRCEQWLLEPRCVRCSANAEGSGGSNNGKKAHPTQTALISASWRRAFCTRLTRCARFVARRRWQLAGTKCPLLPGSPVDAAPRCDQCDPECGHKG